MQFAWGYVPPLVLEAAIRHRVFDVLDGGPKTIAQVQKETGASERGLTAVMNALVGMDFLAKDKQGLFSLTPESSAFLVSTKPSFQGGFLRHGSEQLIPKWLHLNKIVETGRPEAAVNLEEAGGDFFQRFVVDIFPLSYPAAQTLSRHLSADGAVRPRIRSGCGFRSLEHSARAGLEKVDCHRRGLAGSHSHHPENGTRFGLAERFSYIAGDLLQADFGSGHTVATLGHILHSEGRDRSRELLKKTFQALAPGWNHRCCRIPGECG